jgi:hypothetical protein
MFTVAWEAAVTVVRNLELLPAFHGEFGAKLVTSAFTRLRNERQDSSTWSNGLLKTGPAYALFKE